MIQTSVTPRASETDAAGHINNPVVCQGLRNLRVFQL